MLSMCKRRRITHIGLNSLCDLIPILPLLPPLPTTPEIGDDSIVLFVFAVASWLLAGGLF